MAGNETSTCITAPAHVTTDVFESSLPRPKVRSRGNKRRLPIRPHYHQHVQRTRPGATATTRNQSSQTRMTLPHGPASVIARRQLHHIQLRGNQRPVRFATTRTTCPDSPSFTYACLPHTHRNEQRWYCDHDHDGNRLITQTSANYVTRPTATTLPATLPASLIRRAA